MTINLTKELRTKEGKFQEIKAENNHISYCQACLSDKPETLHAVQSPSGKILFVGCVCKAVLTDERIPSLNENELWTLTKNNGQQITYIKPDKSFLKVAQDTLIILRKNGQKSGDMYFNSVENSIKNRKGITIQSYENLLWLFEEVKNW